MQTWSQIGQDLDVAKFYNFKKNGFFVEIGASDGIRLSNTYFLEKILDWKGICSEPVPYKFNLLVKNRPNSFCSSRPVYSTSNQLVTFSISNYCDDLSGISDHIDAHTEMVNANKTDLVAVTISLTELLDQGKAPSFIEYLSLDTEGSEMEILKGVDHEKYKFGIIDVEHNYIEPRRTEMREYLISKGYKLEKENQHDDRYMLIN